MVAVKLNRVWFVANLVCFIFSCFLCEAQLEKDTAIVESDIIVYNQIRQKMPNKISQKLFSLLTRQPHLDTAMVNTAVDEQYIPYKGMIINDIKIIVLNPFGSNIKAIDTVSDANWVEKLANTSHMDTRDWVVKNNLFFKKGQEIDPLTMAENGAFLRSFEYINDVYIYVEPISETHADVFVIIKDNWSVGFRAQNLSTKKADIELYDINLLGFGNNVSVRGIVNTQLSQHFGYGVAYKYINLLGTFVNVNAAYINDITSKNHIYSVERPLQKNINLFGQLSYKSTETDLRHAVWDSLSPTYNTEFSASIGHSFKPVNNNTFSIAARVLDRYPLYKSVDKPESNGNYQYVKNQMLLLQFSLYRQRFFRNHLVNSFGTPEDFAYGYNISTQLGYSRWRQYNREGAYASIKASTNKQHEFGSVYFEGILSSFFDESGPFEGVFNIKLHSFSNLFAVGRYRYRQFFSADYTKRLNHIPNFRNHYLTFSQLAYMDFRNFEKESTAVERLMFKMEGDIFSPFLVLGFRFLFYHFTDFGWIASHNETLLNKHNIYWGTGVGVRIRNDLLVLRTMEIKLGLYPRLNQSGFNNFTNFSSSIPKISPDFRAKYPEEIPL